VTIRHSVRTDEVRDIRVRLLASHQRTLARGDRGRRPQDIFGSRVRELRVERSLTQAELGTLAGLKPATLISIENGRHVPTLDTIHELAAALGIQPAALFPPPSTGDPAQ
jgi:DNA-binding XRE family transcriptional regulator